MIIVILCMCGRSNGFSLMCVVFVSRWQDLLEQYLFKVRIHERKGRGLKVAKLHKKIDRLKRRLAGETVGGGDEGEEVSERLLSRAVAFFCEYYIHPLQASPDKSLNACLSTCLRQTINSLRLSRYP